MSLRLATSTIRPVVRRQVAGATTRNYTAGAAESGPAFSEHREHMREHAKKSAELWRKITIYVALPAIVVAYVNSKNLEKEHHAHIDHIKEENGGELPERIVYPYINKHQKDFPWGKYTLFYNPKTNVPLPDDE